MGWTNYVFAIFVFSLVMVVVFFYDRLRRMRRDRDEDVQQKEQRLFQLFYHLEEMMDSMETLSQTVKEDIRREKASIEDTVLRAERIHTAVTLVLEQLKTRSSAGRGRESLHERETGAEPMVTPQPVPVPARGSLPLSSVQRQRGEGSLASPRYPRSTVTEPSFVEEEEGPFVPLEIPVTRSRPPANSIVNMARGAYQSALPQNESPAPLSVEEDLPPRREAPLPGRREEVDVPSVSVLYGEEVPEPQPVRLAPSARSVQAGESRRGRPAARSGQGDALSPGEEPTRKRRGRPPKAAAATRELTKTERVRQLHADGYNTDHISQELSLSRGEVDLILGFSDRR